MRSILYLIPIGLLLSSFSVHADIYRYKDRSGITVLTSIKPNVKRYTVYKENCSGTQNSCIRLVTKNKKRIKVTTNIYNKAIARASLKYGVDRALIRAIIHTESAFDKHAVSHKGAMGLMQLMPATAKRFGVRNAYNPEQNIDGGVRYLKYLLDMFNNDVRLASAAYNAGENAVIKYNGIPPYKETRNYVVKVARLHKKYQNYY